MRMGMDMVMGMIMVLTMTNNMIMIMAMIVIMTIAGAMGVNMDINPETIMIVIMGDAMLNARSDLEARGKHDATPNHVFARAKRVQTVDTRCKIDVVVCADPRLPTSGHE